tara:strand:+ start:74 stop:391 length:318 start_codon:yes stop_codon:yes gene_type:complete
MALNQVSAKMVAVSIDCSNMQRALAVICFMGLLTGPLQAAEPIRLRVIPYRAGWGSTQIPVHNFQGELRAPPSLPRQVVSTPTQAIRRDNGNEWWLEEDSSWLMD